MSQRKKTQSSRLHQSTPVFLVFKGFRGFRVLLIGTNCTQERLEGELCERDVQAAALRARAAAAGDEEGGDGDASEAVAGLERLLEQADAAAAEARAVAAAAERETGALQAALAQAEEQV